MSPIVGLLDACLNAAPSTFAVAFALALVFWLVVAEEGELRRARRPEAGTAPSAAAAGAPLASSATV